MVLEMITPNYIEKDTESHRVRETTHKKVFTFVSAGVLIFDIIVLLVLAVFVPFIKGSSEGTASITGRSMTAVIEFFVSINGIDYAICFVLLAIILIVKEFPIHNKKETLAVNIAFAMGEISFAVVFTILMQIPSIMMLHDMKKTFP